MTEAQAERMLVLLEDIKQGIGLLLLAEVQFLDEEDDLFPDDMPMSS